MLLQRRRLLQLWRVPVAYARRLRPWVVARRRAAEHRQARTAGRPPRRWAAGLTGLATGLGALLLARRLAEGPLDWTPLVNRAREHGLVMLTVVVGLAALAGAARRLAPERWTARAPRQVRPIRWWMMAAAVALVLVTVWATITVLLHVLPTPPLGQAGQPSPTQTGGAVPGQAGLTLEIIKLGLAVGAGVGTAVALALTARRQWLGERAQAHTEDDARERRLTDLYSDAAGKLGADSDPVVRLGALYSLERLAQAYPEHRQRIVNLICAYLRMPYTPPAQGTASAARRAHSTSTATIPNATTKTDTEMQELQVRSTAQHLLADHLAPNRSRWGGTRNPRFWPGMDLDLSGATLVNLDLADVEAGTARFDGATFTDSARFKKATFTDSARFKKATFTGSAWFDRATFTGIAWFNGATFTDSALFDGATFTGDAWFNGATFTDSALFDRATFTRGLFDRATFTGIASFDETIFTDGGSVDSMSESSARRAWRWTTGP